MMIESASFFRPAGKGNLENSDAFILLECYDENSSPKNKTLKVSLKTNPIVKMEGLQMTPTPVGQQTDANHMDADHLGLYLPETESTFQGKLVTYNRINLTGYPKKNSETVYSLEYQPHYPFNLHDVNMPYSFTIMASEKGKKPQPYTFTEHDVLPVFLAVVDATKQITPDKIAPAGLKSCSLIRNEADLISAYARFAKQTRDPLYADKVTYSPIIDLKNVKIPVVGTSTKLDITNYLIAYHHEQTPKMKHAVAQAASSGARVFAQMGETSVALHDTMTQKFGYSEEAYQKNPRKKALLKANKEE